MNEKDERTAGTLPELRPGLEYIPVTADPRRVQMSGVCESGEVSTAKEDPTMVMVIDKINSLISGLTSLGMIYVLVRMLMMV